MSAPGKLERAIHGETLADSSCGYEALLFLTFAQHELF
jgi:hypothetical protein